MDDDIKFLIETINEKLKKNYNLISFNEMKSTELLQLLCESINSVYAEKKLDFEQQGIDGILAKIPTVLNNIGYKNNFEAEKEMAELRKGDKDTIHPILIWIFKNFEKASLRAYLAEYLVRINVPTVYLQNPEIQSAYKNYLSLIDSFKKVHLEYQKTKEDYKMVKETEEKIDNLNKNIVFLNSRVNESKEKINKVPNINEVMQSIETLWAEHQKEEEMLKQMNEQQNLIEQLDAEYEDLQQQLESVQTLKLTANNPLVHIEEELNQNISLMNNLLRQIDDAQKKVEHLRQVVNLTDVSEGDLNTWREKIIELQNELLELEEKKRKEIDPLSIRLAPYRKELAAITENQQKALNNLNKTKMAYQMAENTMKEKQAAVDKLIGHEVKRGNELKEYIQKLREKNKLVEHYKEIISGFKSEYEILQRTMEILSQKHPDLKDIFEKRKKGVVTQAQTINPTTTPNMNSLSEIIKLYKQTRLNIDNSKAQLSAYMQEVLPLREAVRNVNQRLNEIQKKFNAEIGALKQEHEIASREVENLKVELKQKEEQWKTLQREIQNKEETLERIQQENDNDDGSDGTFSQKSTLETKLQELEREVHSLESRKKELAKIQNEQEITIKSWETTKKLMEIKIRNREANNKNVQKIGRTEILTL